MQGKSVDEGDPLIQLADTSQMTARIYIPEFSMHDLRPGSTARLLVQGHVFPLSARVANISASSTLMDPLMVAKEQLQGLTPPHYYLASATIGNDGSLLEGMTGSAKVFAGRRSLAGFGYRFGRDLVRRKVW